MANSHQKSKSQLLVELFMAQMRSDKQALPLEPTVPAPEVRVLRARLMLEECLETIQKGLGVAVVVVMQTGEEEFEQVSVNFKALDFSVCGQANLVEIADGLADCEVVNLGTASACGIAMAPVQDVVNQNNLEKFAPGHSFSPDGKLLKPPGHKPPDIATVLFEQHQAVVDPSKKFTQEYLTWLRERKLTYGDSIKGEQA